MAEPGPLTMVRPAARPRPLTLAVVLSTTFLVVRSLLLPTSSLLTFSLA